MNKKVPLILLLMFLSLGINMKSHAQNFISVDQIEEDIKNYYKERLDRSGILKLTILDIIKAKSGNLWYVYFLEGINVDSVKDMNNNINSTNTPVMMAVYQYSYLKNIWELEQIDRAPEGMYFKIGKD